MPTTVRADPARGMLHLDVRGVLSTGEMVAALDEGEAAFGGHPVRRVLSDHRGVVVASTPVQVAAILDRLGRRGGAFRGARCAVVVAQPASYGMMRMLATHAEQIPMTVQVFWDYDEASRWLDQPATGGAGDERGESGNAPVRPPSA